MEIYVLDCFRQHGTTALRLADIVDGCTVTRRNALKETLLSMATDQHLIKRTPVNDGDVVELTETGKRFAALAGGEASDHIDHLG